MKHIFATALMVALSSITIAATEATAGLDARSIMATSLASDDGHINSVNHYIMVLRDKAGTESKRQLELRTLEHTQQHHERSLVIFHTPLAISGTALLSHARGQQDDIQWLYLPSLKRVKRISGANRAAPFLGSEFSFEDLAPQALERYTYQWEREDQLADLVCDVILRHPKHRSGYSAQRLWIDRTDHQVRKIEFLDRAGRHHKTLTFNEYRIHQDKFWRSHNLHMVNHVNGKSTDLQLEQVNFGLDLPKQTFEKANLDRIRP